MNPKESAEFIVKHAKSVKVNDAGIENLAKEVSETVVAFHYIC